MPVIFAENQREQPVVLELGHGMAEPIRRFRARLARLNPAQIRAEAGHLHRHAHEQGLGLLACLAQQMIRHMGPNDGRGIASAYLDAMSDVADSADFGACDRHADHWLALVAVRLGA